MSDPAKPVITRADGITRFSLFRAMMSSRGCVSLFAKFVKPCLSIPILLMWADASNCYHDAVHYQILTEPIFDRAIHSIFRIFVYEVGSWKYENLTYVNSLEAAMREILTGVFRPLSTVSLFAQSPACNNLVCERRLLYAQKLPAAPEFGNEASHCTEVLKLEVFVGGPEQISVRLEHQKVTAYKPQNDSLRYTCQPHGRMIRLMPHNPCDDSDSEADQGNDPSDSPWAEDYPEDEADHAPED